MNERSTADDSAALVTIDRANAESVPGLSPFSANAPPCREAVSRPPGSEATKSAEGRKASTVFDRVDMMRLLVAPLDLLVEDAVAAFEDEDEAVEGDGAAFGFKSPFGL